MMNEKLNFERIEEFLDGDLTGDELMEFEQDLLDDSDLQMELDLHEEINMAIMEDDVMDLRAKLEAIEPPASDKKRRLSLFLGKWQLAAASLILMIGISSLFYLLGDRTYTNEEIYSSYYKPYNVVINTRSAEGSTNDILVNALQSYEAKDYRTALSLFKDVLDKDSLNVTGNFYSGVSNIEIKEYDAANVNFTRVIKHKNNLFLEQSEWNLAFCYLMTEEKEKAIKQFQYIAASNSYYKSKAQEILNKLE
ncbi:MAG: hypothetical protein ACEPOZ_05355 [Marinifilaceae bacterium]